MLKKDFNGYAEFTKKIKETSGEERAEVYMERTQMWTDKFMNLINPLPKGDLVFVITSLESIAAVLRKDDVVASALADVLKMEIGIACETQTITGRNMTEAALRTYAEVWKNKK